MVSSLFSSGLCGDDGEISDKLEIFDKILALYVEYVSEVYFGLQFLMQNDKYLCFIFSDQVAFLWDWSNKNWGWKKFAV